LGLRITSSTTLAAQRSILLQQKYLQSSLQKLSSGLKINSAADDPAGLAISEQLRANIASTSTMAANTSRAVNVVQTAEGALAEVNTQLAQIRGLVVEAGNGAILGETGLQAIQDQIAGGIASINRVAETTQFAGRPLLNGEFQNEEFAISEGDPARLTIPNMAANELGRGVGNESNFRSLAGIDVRTPQGAADALSVVDAAINDVSGVRNDLGSFQTNVLETTSRTLETNRQNLLFSESTIRDTDYANASGEAVLSQIRLQASVLAQNAANRRTGMLLDLMG
jgi:flagellin